MKEEEQSNEIIGAAIEVHKHWGPGLHEEIYEKSLCCELELRNLDYRNQLEIPLLHKGKPVGDNLRLDISLEENNSVGVEVRERASSSASVSVDDLYEINGAQNWAAYEF